MPWPDPADSVTRTTIPRRPGLGEKDRQILDEFFRLDLVPDAPLWFNIPLSDPPSFISTVSDPVMRRAARFTWSKKVDLIIDNGQALWICEVKPYASYVALGQSLLYTGLARRMPDPIAVPVPVILTDVADPDLLLTLPSVPAVTVLELGRALQPRPSFQT